MVDFEVEALDGFLQLLKFIEELDALLNEDFFTALRIIVIFHESDVLDERFDLDAGASHAFDERDPFASLFVEIANAVFLTGDIREQSDPLVITNGIGGHAELFTDFANGHMNNQLHLKGITDCMISVKVDYKSRAMTFFYYLQRNEKSPSM